MIKRRSLVLMFLAASMRSPPSHAGESYVDRAVQLDAEELAEGGIRNAYVALLPELRRFVAKPDSVEEELHPTGDRYVVRSGDTEYVIYEVPPDDLFDLWARATVVFFEIINKQLLDTKFQFFALYGGNDLHGVFLAADEVEKIRQTEANREEWPYTPTLEAPWYGQHHNGDKARPWYQTTQQ